MRTFDARARECGDDRASAPGNASPVARRSCADSIFSTLVSQIAYFFVDGR